MPQFDFDIGIIGGGPAGSATAAYLARAGLSCVIFESELFPRPHVGESLVPSSTRVFQEIGFLDQMDEAGFPEKYGAAWTINAPGSVHSHTFEGLALDSYTGIRFEERSQPGVERNYTFHVDRARFDLLLLQHAHRLGAQVYEGVRVQSVDFSEAGRPRICVALGKQEMHLRVRMVVDASGSGALCWEINSTFVPGSSFRSICSSYLVRGIRAGCFHEKSSAYRLYFCAFFALD